MEFMNLFFNEDLFKNKLKKFNSPFRLSLKENYLIDSVVLLLIIPYNDKPYDLVLICRTHRPTDRYAGEVAFPGGLYEPQIDDTYEETALRETEEELGIPRDKIHIMGCIDDVITPKGHKITPFVGFIDKLQNMVKNDDEVQEIIKVPISFLANKKNYKERAYRLRDDTIAVGRYNYKTKNKKYVIFGATSHMIVNFIELVYGLRLMKLGCRRLRGKDIEFRERKVLNNFPPKLKEYQD